ncbi:MAG: hypothetical protein HQK65_03305 [Desulfamplus sp.]|nr:hypothetical protein [Desulfamplus sp.]
MTTLSGLFGWYPKNIEVQTYGKLPFYEDYISIVTTKQGIKWRDWILNIFGQNGMDIPVGVWPFIFKDTYQSNIIVGLIEPSSDALRSFPFSIFVEFKLLKPKYNWNFFSQAIEKLRFINSDLNMVRNINDCYDILGGKTIKTGDLSSTNQHHENEDITFIEPFLLDSKNMHPLFFVVLDYNQSVHLISDNSTPPNDLIAKWKSLGGCKE